MADTSFVDESREQSKVKTTIVPKYFWAWAKVISATFCYIYIFVCVCIFPRESCTRRGPGQRAEMTRADQTIRP